MVRFRSKFRFMTFFLFCLSLFLFAIVVVKYLEYANKDNNIQEQQSQQSQQTFGQNEILTPTDGNGKRELVLLQIVYRHGHRAPFDLYQNDPNPESFWKEGLGSLTQLGRLQHFVLGLHLQDRYRDFITTNPVEVQMMSADSNRCQFGAYSFLAGLYRPTREFQFTDELQWQPIPVRYVPEPKDRYVLSRRKCPIANDDERMWKMSNEAEDMKKFYKPIYDFWSKHSGSIIVDWVSAANLGKNLLVERDYNLTIPPWALVYWDDFRTQEGLSYYWHFKTKLIQKYRIGPLIGYMVEKMKEKIKGDLPDKKVLIYSAHGSNIACLLLAFDLYNMLAPPHAATITLELWKEPNQEHTVRMLYFNSSNPERQIDPPNLLQIKGCDEYCPLSHFDNLTFGLVPQDWLRECHDFLERYRFRVDSQEVLQISSSIAQTASIILLLLTFIFPIFIQGQ